MMKCKGISIIIAFVLYISQLPAKEPFRAGIDVPEPKLIKKVEINYPEQAIINGVSGQAILGILIDEQGSVADIQRGGASGFRVTEFAIAAVKEWRFSPTYVEGKPVAVAATVVVVFTPEYTPSVVELERPIDEETAVILDPMSCFIPFTLDRDGHLKELPPLGYTCNGRNENMLIPHPDVPFPLIEARMKKGTPLFSKLRTPQYRFKTFESEDSGQLYYSVLLVSNGAQLIQLAGVDPSVKPPVFDVDFARLAGSLDISHFKRGAVFFCTLFVDKNGRILCVDGSGAEAEALGKALKKATVITPGMRNDTPVPTAVTLAIPVK
jgi:TonB family protein